MDRNQGSSADAWAESVVVGEDAFVTVSFKPWPGLEAWDTYSNLFEEDVSLFDLSDNLLEDRGAAYEIPIFATPSGSTLEGNWKVIENPC